MSEHSQASRLTERRQPGGDYNRFQGIPEHGDAIRGQPRLAEQAMSACSQGVATATMAAAAATSASVTNQELKAVGVSV